MNTRSAAPYVAKCPVGCNAALETTDIVLPEGALLRCSECGQLLSQCSEEAYWKSMEEFNDPVGTLPGEDTMPRQFGRSKKFLDQIRSLLNKEPGDIHLLDVGCSSGAFLNVAVKLGYQSEGVEPAALAAATAQAAGLKVRCGLLEEIGYAAESFDAITLFEVIEHLKDPLPLLAECRRILKPGGILLIGTANADSWTARSMKKDFDYFSIKNHGGHVSFFNPGSMEKLGEKAGFRLVRIKTKSVRFCDRSNSREPAYTLLKILGELSNPVASLLHKGADMTVYLERK